MTAFDEATGDRGSVESRVVRTAFDVIEDVVYVIDEDGNAAFWNETLEERTGYSSEEIATMGATDFLPREQWEKAPGLIEAIEDIEDRRIDLDLLTKSGERIPHEFRGTTYEDPVTGEQYRYGVARDITDRLHRERSLRQQRDELETFDRINELLLETVRELIQTTSRDAVERIVCERLAASEFYSLAWIGERDFDGHHVLSRAVAGEDADAVGEVSVRIDDDASPAVRAFHTGEVQVVSAREQSAEWWNAVIGTDPPETVAAVPLSHGDTVYGVLEIHSRRPDAFSEREQAGFGALGMSVGVVIHAARSRELLFADSVVELEFDVTDADIPLVTIGTEREAHVELEGYVAAGEHWLLYIEVSGATTDEIVAAIDDEPAYPDYRVISDGDDGGRIEIQVAESSLLSLVTDAGATVVTASGGRGDATVTVETPANVDAREVVTQIREAYPEAKLRSHRERDREISPIGRPEGVLDELTDRQRESIVTAYRAGYFDWPRESSAEQVADSIGIDNSTLHGHLRKGQKRLLSALIDEE